MNNYNFSNSRRHNSQSIFTQHNRVISRPQPPPLLDFQSEIYDYEQQSNQDSQRLQELVYMQVQNMMLHEVQNFTNRLLNIVLNRILRSTFRGLRAGVLNIISNRLRFRQSSNRQIQSYPIESLTRQIQSFPLSFSDEVRQIESTSNSTINIENQQPVQLRVINIENQRSIDLTPNIQANIQIPLYITQQTLDTNRVRTSVPCNNSNSSPISISSPVRYISETTPDISSIDFEPNWIYFNESDGNGSLNLNRVTANDNPNPETNFNLLMSEFPDNQMISSGENVEISDISSEPSTSYVIEPNSIFSVGIGMVGLWRDNKFKCGVYANDYKSVLLGIQIEPTLHGAPAETPYKNGIGGYFSIATLFKDSARGAEINFVNTPLNWEIELSSRKLWQYTIGHYGLAGFLRLYPNAMPRLHGSISINSQTNTLDWEENSYISSLISLSFGLPKRFPTIEKLKKQLFEARAITQNLQSQYDKLEVQHTQEITLLELEYNKALDTISRLQKLQNISDKNLTEKLQSELISTQNQLQGCLLTLQKTPTEFPPRDKSILKSLFSLHLWSEFFLGITFGICIEICRFLCRALRDRTSSERIKVWCTILLYFLPTGFFGISILIYLGNGITNIIQNRAFFAPNQAIEAIYTPIEYVGNKLTTQYFVIDSLAYITIYILQILLRTIILINLVCLGIPYTPTIAQENFRIFLQPYIQPFVLKISSTLIWRIFGAYLVTWLSQNYAKYQKFTSNTFK